ncbi:hypothetical protein SH668x_001790 [Planctomicrobium sp. SH668]|uniref:hypothetical protein n=1 Tax=Planctomicrobium sp. SH668 TaxID=3448126 RepID=UPI003F5CB806
MKINSSRTTNSKAELDVILSRIKAGAFMTVVCGLLFLTVSSTLENDATRTILLSTLTALFVCSGGLLGLVSMHHVCHTHLPDLPEDVDANSELNNPDLIVRTRQRGVGLMGLLAFGSDPARQSLHKGDASK